MDFNKIYQRSNTMTVGKASTIQIREACNSTDRLLSGGVYTQDGDIKLRASFPTSVTSWEAIVRNDHPFNNGSAEIKIICVRP